VIQNAFQQNAFFNPGFQISYSQMAFQKCAFDATAFQTDPCDTPSGRSGYWRLFFTQMQEEALKEYEKKTGAPVTKPVVPAEPVTAKAKTPKKPKRVEPEVKVETYPEVPKFKLKPVYETPDTYDALANLPKVVLASELTALQAKIYDFQVHLDRKQRQQRNRRRAAAFLLLAA
jgi:hypothetical protein